MLLFCLLVAMPTSSAQFNTESARKELEKRGLTEQEVRDALLAKGIDINNINTSDPSELAKYEKTIRQVIEELEAKKKSTAEGISDANTQQIDGNKVEIKAAIKDEGVAKAVEDGSTVDEAISEEIQEEQNKLIPSINIYGHQLFKDKTLKLFRTTEGAKVPPSYRLGSGDIVNVAIWGDTEYNLTQEINKEGFIKPDRKPRIFLSGLSIEEAKKVVSKQLRKSMYFNPSQIAVTLITSRTININIVGEVFNPGSYNISAINTGVNALVAAGGPNRIGSVRNIKLLSPTNGEKTIDLYQYLLNPVSSQNYYLRENDYIQVPVAKKIVTIGGAVKRPLGYELLENENLNKLIDFTGGFTANALQRNIEIKRIKDGENVIINVDYQNTRTGDFALEDGDIILVKSGESEIENSIAVFGAIKNEGEYEFKVGMKIIDVLNKAVLEKDAIKDLVYIRRLNPDFKTRRYELINIEEALADPSSTSNIELMQGDIITISSYKSYAQNYTVDIKGEVRRPGTFSLDNDDDLKVSELIFLAGGVTDDVNNFGYIIRKDAENPNKPEYIYLDLETILKKSGTEADRQLKPGDIVTLYSKKQFFDESFISVEGAVRNPGEYEYNEGISLRDALLFSGGLKREASTSRIEVYRIVLDGDKKSQTLVANVRVEQSDNFERASSFFLQPYDQIRVRKAPEFELLQNVTISGEITYPGRYSLLSDNTRLSDIIRQAGKTTNEAFLGGATLIRNFEGIGYVVIDLEEALESPGGKNDIILRDGDVLNIPKSSSLVAISGATNAAEYYPESVSAGGKININFEGSMRANRYINKYAGGVANDGDKRSIVVEYPNGQIRKTKRFLFFNVYPKVREGSHIKVAKKPVKTKEEKEDSDIDWGEVLSNSITQATAILSLVLLLRSLD